MLPPIPSWNAIHPLVVHFPIALLMVSPVLVLTGALVPRHGRWISLSALIIMALGTIAAYVAVATGEAGAELVPKSPAIAELLEEHEELAELSRTLFTILTIVFAAILIVPWKSGKDLKPRVQAMIHGVFLLCYLGSMIVLANAAHHGGLLVHGYGVHAAITTPPLEHPYKEPGD